MYIPPEPKHGSYRVTKIQSVRIFLRECPCITLETTRRDQFKFNFECLCL